ncbi:MAG: YkvA family protein [Novosphingobium sp.]
MVLDRLRAWAHALKRNVLVLWLAARNPRVPVSAKLLAALVAGYALSPIDLIPDFVPILGLLDDLLLVPAGIWLTLRLIPGDLVAELQAAAADHGWPAPSRRAAAVIVAIWLALTLALAALLYSGNSG